MKNINPITTIAFALLFLTCFLQNENENQLASELEAQRATITHLLDSCGGLQGEIKGFKDDYEYFKKRK